MLFALVIAALTGVAPSWAAPDLWVPPDWILRWQPRTPAEAARPFGLPRVAELPGTSGRSTPLSRESSDPPGGRWGEIGPPPRAWHMLAYDAGADQLVMFGGGAPLRPYHSLWTRSRARADAPWIEASVTGDILPGGARTEGVFDPVQRRCIALVADSVLRVAVLDLATMHWRLVDALDAPPARTSSAVAYDPVRDMVVVHGGIPSGITPSAEIWRLPLDGTAQWTRLEPTGVPVARAHHAIAYDAARDRIVGVGGPGGAGVFAFTLGDGAAWSSVGTGPLLDRADAQCAVDPVADELLAAADDGSTAAISLATGAVRWLTLAGSGTRREGFAFAFDDTRRELVLHGGRDHFGEWNFAATAVMPLTGPAWTRDALVDPGHRIWHEAVIDRARHRMIVEGGHVPGVVDTLVALSLGPEGGWAVLEPAPGPRPRPRFGHGLVYDEVGDRLLLFGGQALDGTGDYLADLWELRLGGIPTWTRVTTSGPEPAPRANHGVWWDAPRQRLLLFAGADSHKLFDDAWQATIANGEVSWTNLLPRGSLPTTNSSIHGVPGADEVWALGFPNQLWRIPLAGAFTPTAQTFGGLELPFGFQVLGFDARRQRIVGVPPQPGQAFRSDLRELWWLPVHATPDWSAAPTTATPPPVRFLASAVIDPVTDRLILHGGYDDGTEYYGDTWALQWDQPTPALASLASASADAAGTRIEWHVAGVTTAMLQQRRAGDAWRDVVQLVATGDGRLTYAGPPLPAGERHEFRLAVGAGHAGFVALAGPDAAITALAGALANPCAGDLVVSCAFAAAQPATLELLDLAGRRLEQREWSAPEPGTRTERLAPAGRHAPGVYFLRLRQGRTQHLARVAIVR